MRTQLRFSSTVRREERGFQSSTSFYSIILVVISGIEIVEKSASWFKTRRPTSIVPRPNPGSFKSDFRFYPVAPLRPFFMTAKPLAYHTVLHDGRRAFLRQNLWTGMEGKLHDFTIRYILFIDRSMNNLQLTSA